jgi:3-oxoacyl-[acyl-carrier protein] reductase
MSDRHELDGKLAVVTGTSRGIGAAIATSLADSGAYVVGNFVDPRKAARQEKLLATIKEAGGLMSAVQADITTDDGRRALLEHARSVSPDHGVDFLVLNAAGGLEAGKPDNWAYTINVEAQQQLATDFLPIMNQGGAIVYMTSLWAHNLDIEPLPNYGPVAETKHESEQLFRGRIPEFAEHDVRLGIVCGHIIQGTGAYTIFTKNAQSTLDELRPTTEAGEFPLASEMGDAVRELLISDFSSGYILFVGGTDVKLLDR